jgi:hypothetical protein
MTTGSFYNFRAAGRSLCVCLRFASNGAPNTGNLPSTHVVAQQEKKPQSQKSYAQVESLVLPPPVLQNSCGLRPGGITHPKSCHNIKQTRQDSPLTFRASGQQKSIIRLKAKAAGIPVGQFILAAALGSDYRPPMNRELIRALLGLNRELTVQGNNLNQIARHLNAGVGQHEEGPALKSLALSLGDTLRALREALVSGGPERGP